MGNFIVKLADRYLIWSSISDSPASYGMTLDELEEYYREEHGAAGMRDLPARLARVEAKGTSAHDDTSADDTIWLNRAGPGEKPLHREEIIEFFVRRREDPTAATLRAFRKGLPRCGPKCPSIRDKDGCGAWCKRCWGTDHVRSSLQSRIAPEEP